MRAEDDLLLDVLTAIAKGDTADSADLAAEALLTQTIDFDRWYA